MSRAKATDVSSPISLFPFIGVLLCTMGALLVVLIAVSPSGRAIASRQVTTPRKATVADDDPRTREQLERVKQYVAQLNRVRSEAEAKLREGQLRLSHLESHMRRLEDQLRSLQLAAQEMVDLEQEHYDDREQAEREAERLQQLIAQMRATIDSLKQEQNTKKRSYALVPYEGPNGTFRRPIYVECRNDELILQPEGVRISVDDLRPPIGAGNPLAAALRAAREHLLEIHPEENQNRDTEPYPLLVVRPSGTAMFAPAQRAIKSGDFDFGYELVEENWDMKYPAPDPQLAVVAQRAIDHARIRQQALAAAAPRAYQNPALAVSGRFDVDDDSPVMFVGNDELDSDGRTQSGVRGHGASLAGVGLGAGGGIGLTADGTEGGAAAPGGAMTGNTPGGKSVGHVGGASRIESGEGAPADKPGNSKQPSGGKPGTFADGGKDGPGGPLPSGSSVPPVGGAMAGTSGQSQSAASSATDSSASAMAGSDAAGTGTPALPDGDYSKMQTELAKSRGKDWALQRKKARAVPVRRAIQIVVRGDQLAILSDNARLNSTSPTGKTIPLKGDTVESVDELVAAVHDQIEGWGMAGDGLYWRPVLSLHVAPDGLRRAQDLERLLKNSGLELEPATAANANSRGDTGASTR